jgi:hypothetical protein
MGLLLLIVLAMLLFSFAGYLICYLLFGSGKFWSQAEPARSRTAREAKIPTGGGVPTRLGHQSAAARGASPPLRRPWVGSEPFRPA